MIGIRTLPLIIAILSSVGQAQLLSTKEVPSPSTTAFPPVYGFAGTGKVIVAVDPANRDVVITIFDSTNNHAGGAVLSQVEVKEVLNQIAVVLSDWSQNHNGNQGWIYTTAKIDPKCSLGCLILSVNQFGTTIAASYADSQQPHRATSVGDSPKVLSDLVKLLDPSLKVLTGTWTPPPPLTKAQQKAAAKAAKQEQKRAEAAEEQRADARCYQLRQIPIGQLSADQLRSLALCQ